MMTEQGARSCSPFRVAAVQPFEPHDREENERMQAAAWGLVARAAAAGARLVVLPEYFNVMGLDPRDAGPLIEAAGSQRERARSVCRELGIWLLVPLIEQRGSRRLNCAHLFEPGGTVALTYDKTHLTLGEREGYGLSPGEAITTVDTALCRIGVMICYDIYFPEVARLLGLQGVQLLLFPSLQRSEMEESMMLLNRVRAMDATSYLVRSSYGQPRGTAYRAGTMYGGSCVIAPDGSILAGAGRYEGIAIAEVDPHTPWQRQRCGELGPEPVRRFLLEDRRPQLYRPIADGDTDHASSDS